MGVVMPTVPLVKIYKSPLGVYCQGKSKGKVYIVKGKKGKLAMARSK